MANFKVGQRVKRARHVTHGVPVGATGVITGFKDDMWSLAPLPEAYIAWDNGDLNIAFPAPYSFAQESLEPLIGPEESADTWAADKVKELVKPKPMDAERAPHEWTTERIG